uniref:Trace amine-associated receptor 7b-like n=1 Tax=Petromyzon marinus TaxID=7757 RepID=A0AAJ7T9L9_PETMA|nr:trace amine-associated receptor 7b-like [Petromyzon marinus]
MNHTSAPSTRNPCVTFRSFNCTGPSLPENYRALLLAILAFFTLATILGNLLIISSIAFFRQLQSFPNVLALSLAFSDFLVGLVIMPLAVTKVIYNCWFYARLYCNVHYFLDFTFTNCSILHLCSIALNRYVAITDPLRYESRVTRRTLVVMLVTCWLGSAVSSSPILLSLSPTLSVGTIKRISCPDDCVFDINIGIMVVIGYCPYFASLVVIVCIYGKIYRIARAQVTKIRAQQGGGLRTMKREHSATKTLGVIIGFFLISWLPYYVIVLASLALADTLLAYRVALWIGYISSAFNPILYAAFNRPFRNAFRLMFRLKVFGEGARDTDLSGRLK